MEETKYSRGERYRGGKDAVDQSEDSLEVMDSGPRIGQMRSSV